jgi:hypothetical protein
MPASTAPSTKPRRWIVRTIKAGLAIAALTSLAQWVPRGSPEPVREATRPATAIMDPISTGTLRSRAPAAVANKVELDQRGLLSLVSQTQSDTSRPPIKLDV